MKERRKKEELRWIIKTRENAQKQNGFGMLVWMRVWDVSGSINSAFVLWAGKEYIRERESGPLKAKYLCYYSAFVYIICLYNHSLLAIYKRE